MKILYRPPSPYVEGVHTIPIIIVMNLGDISCNISWTYAWCVHNHWLCLSFLFKSIWIHCVCVCIHTKYMHAHKHGNEQDRERVNRVSVYTNNLNYTHANMSKWHSHRNYAGFPWFYGCKWALKVKCSECSTIFLGTLIKNVKKNPWSLK